MTAAHDMTDNAAPDENGERPAHGAAHDRPGDEVTSAADADWLAALRATAKQHNTSLADLVDDAGPETEPGPAHTDDESTIGSPTALDDIRRFAREERERTESAAPLADADPQPVPEPATPAVPPEIRQATPRLGSVSANGDVPRWEAPPRLEAATDAGAPPVVGRTHTQHQPDWRITVLAIVVAMLLGVVIALLFFRNDPAPPIEDEPDNTTLVDGSIVAEAPADAPPDGS